MPKNLPGLTTIYKLYQEKRLWQLLIDGKVIPAGPFALDHKDLHGMDTVKEPGYLQGMLNAMNYLLSTMNQPVTVLWLENLHGQAVKNVVHIRQTPESKEKTYKMLTPGFRIASQHVKFNLIINSQGPSNATSAGIDEIEVELKEYAHTSPKLPYTLIEIYKDESEKIYVYSISCTLTGEDLKDLVNKELTNYYDNIKKPGLSTDEKLLIIINLISRLERIHPFRDGNCRTFYLLLQKLLIENGFGPVILDNPNRLDAVDSNQLILEIKEGMLSAHLQATTYIPEKSTAAGGAGEERMTREASAMPSPEETEIPPEDIEKYQELISHTQLPEILEGLKILQNKDPSISMLWGVCMGLEPADDSVLSDKAATAKESTQLTMPTEENARAALLAAPF